jgi:hypothetical protein
MLSLVSAINVAAQSKAWTIFAHLNTGVVSSNVSRSMKSVPVSFLFCVVRVGRGLAKGWTSVRDMLPTVWDQETEKAAKAQQRSIEP